MIAFYLYRQVLPSLLNEVGTDKYYVIGGVKRQDADPSRISCTERVLSNARPSFDSMPAPVRCEVVGKNAGAWMLTEHQRPAMWGFVSPPPLAQQSGLIAPLMI